MSVCVRLLVCVCVFLGWEAGIALARSFLEGRRISVSGGNSLSVGSRIRNTTILLAEALKINPYDQPAVELIKTDTFKILKKN